MKVKMKVAGILGIVLALGLLSGCTSLSGVKLTKAMVKQLDTKSLQADSQISLNIQTKGLDITDEEQGIIDQINKTSINISEQSDIKNNRYIAAVKANVDGTEYDGELYIRGEKFWAKIPSEDKYIEYSPNQLVMNNESPINLEQQVKLQNKMKPIAMKFIKDYVQEYKYAFNNISNKGNAIITTPEGQKEVTLIELKIDNSEVRDLIKYTINNAVNSDTLVEYIKAIITLMYNEDPSLFEGQLQEELLEEIDKTVEEGRDSINSSPEDFESTINQITDEIMNYVKIGESGLVFTYGIDNNDNIVSVEEKLALTIMPEGDESQVISLKVSSKSVIYGINKTKVTLPQFNTNNTIKIKEYVRSVPTLKESVLGEAFGVNKKCIVMTIGMNYSMTNGKYNYLEAEPYIEGEYTLVPVRFIGEALGANIEWNDETQTITYKDDENTIIMQIDNTMAYVNGQPIEMPVAPTINNDRTMVPLRFISEQFGAEVEWDGSLNQITINKD